MYNIAQSLIDNNDMFLFLLEILNKSHMIS